MQVSFHRVRMARQLTAQARVGCSGWHYASWAGRFYPKELPSSAWLTHYATEFDTVELNNSFYRLPSAEQFQRWRTMVPPDFLFAVKASRFLTHLKRLRDPESPLDLLIGRASKLGPTLGPVLYQLPPRWVPDLERLTVFLSALPAHVGRGRARRHLSHAIEFRDPRGYEPATLDALRAAGVALCVHDMHGSESPRARTGPFVYVRFHGYGARYGGSYPDPILRGWTAWLVDLLAQGVDVFAYFNNDIDAHAVGDARRLREMLARWAPAREQPDRSAKNSPVY
jgi:uncharacterized protein YecE (DUF72 family)